jgi:hypothetical protein
MDEDCQLVTSSLPKHAFLVLARIAAPGDHQQSAAGSHEGRDLLAGRGAQFVSQHFERIDIEHEVEGFALGEGRVQQVGHHVLDREFGKRRGHPAMACAEPSKAVT